MRLALMIEGQEDVKWPQWLEIAAACERLGFEALLRSDHYLSVDDRAGRGSLDAWATICALAARTDCLRLGTLVSPASFRHPSVLAKLVASADVISAGRVELGIGTGWWELEHLRYGFPFATGADRMQILSEQLEIIRGHWGPGPFTFHGRHYRVDSLDALPKPAQLPSVPIVVGGAARPRSIALATLHATEYNTYYVDPHEAARRRQTVREECERVGRDPDSLSFSVMTGLLVGTDANDLARRVRALADWRGFPNGDAYLAEVRRTWIIGTPTEVLERIEEYRGAGVERIVLQHHLHWDLEALEIVANHICPSI